MERLKREFSEEGFEGVLEGRTITCTYEVKIDGDAEARLVKLACSEPPEGFARWSLRLLAQKMVELHNLEGISHISVDNVPKKNELKPWRINGTRPR